MHILLLNWRCPTNPKSGGAEYIVFELLKERVKKGDSVTWFAMTYEGAKSEEVIDGIKVIRQGGAFSMQAAARRWYKSNYQKVDLIVDQTHGLPFFAPRWAKCPVLFYSNEVAGPIAKFMLPWPLGSLYQLVEPWFVYQYKNTPAVTISNSTTQDLRRLGYKAPIITMPLACDTKPLTRLPALSTKEKELTLIFAARLVPLKRPDHAIKALSYIIKEEPTAKLWVIGKGEKKYEKFLHNLVKQSGLNSQVKFWGFVSAAKKKELMSKAHIVLITSIKEGWGLTVPEANALGTVGVTYNIAGVRDSNVNGQTGLHSQINSPKSLAEAVLKMWHKPKLYQKYRTAAWQLSKERTWAKTHQAFNEAIKLVSNRE